jgi:alpha-1,3-rhamnosyl/mannosyltransferase
MGAAAQYVNPEDVDDMASGMLTVLNNEYRKLQLIEAGKQRVQDFTWEKCALQTLGLYEKVVSS